MKIIYKQNNRFQKLQKLRSLSEALLFEVSKKDNASRLRIPRLMQKIKSLLQEIKGLVSLPELKKVLGPACLLFGLTVATQTNAQTFAPVIQNPFGLSATLYIASPAITDLDNDGDLDMLVGEYYGNLQYFKNNGTVSAPAFLAPVQNPNGLSSVSNYVFPTFVDLDNDGDKDLMVGEYAAGALYYFKNIGTASAPSFSAPVTNPYGTVSTASLSAPAFTDLDNDGDFDMLVGEAGGNMQYFQNTGTASAPAFSAPVQNPFGLTATYGFAFPTFTDLDGDGDKDLMVGDGAGAFQYFKNNGTALLAAFAAPLANPFSLTAVTNLAVPAFADIDNDGDKDLFAGEYGGSINYFQQLNTVGVNNFSGAAEFRVYPNPAHETLRISGLREENVTTIELMDVSGRVIGEYPASTKSISVSNLESGMYMLKITNLDGRSEIKKIQKQ